MNGFQRTAVVGFGLGVVLAGLLGPPWWVIGLLALSGVLTALAVVAITLAVTGEEQLVHQHHEIAVLGTSAMLLALLDKPVLAGLDAVALGLGLMVAVGRLGCLQAGCCHGRPSRWGVVYGRHHLDGEFPRHLVGIPLLPVPAIESLALFAIVAAGAVMVRSGAAAGAALAWFVVASSTVRFGLELLRGDTVRRRAFGVTEAQVIALALTAGVAGVTRAAPAIAAAGALAAATALLVVSRRGRWSDRDDDALAIAVHAAAARHPTLMALPCGLLVSAGRTGATTHLTLSAPHGAGVPARRIRRVAAVAVRLVPGRSAPRIEPGGAQTVHVLLGRDGMVAS